ncbi:hypothetical protein V494_08591 [Pseudogymnoascus sp. VKM F-4513 (FW-928)]|nr:hypothetical protein V494_08591 [Pseudogymnoascus sp. VKM F-4513 (FW-928)]
MIPLSTVRASNACLRDLPPITAVIAGATSGLGESALRALAENNTAPRVYIIGRSEERAAAVIADCLKICPGGTFTFLSADLTLIKNVDTVCAEILKREEGGKLDLLFMTHGYITFEGRRETSEGLDALMVLRYYSRIRLLTLLLPLLQRAPSPRAVSIFAPNHERGVYPDDLSLRTHHSVLNHLSHAVFMTTFSFSHIAAENPSLSCLHIHPGLVKTPEFEHARFSPFVKWLFHWVILPLIAPLLLDLKESGERNLFMSTSAKFRARSVAEGESGTMVPVVEEEVATGVNGLVGGGVYAVNWNGNVCKGSEKFYREWGQKGLGDKVWEHTMKAFETIERGEVFLD